MKEIFQYFADVLLVAMRDIKFGCSLALAIPYTRQKLREPMNSQILFLKICPVAG